MKLVLLLLLTTVGCANRAVVAPVPDARAVPVMLTWTSNPQPPGVTVTGQRLYRDSACGRTGTLLIALDPTVLAYRDIAARRHTTYAYWMTVLNQGGKESPRSNCVTARTP